ncbi:MAG: hypothetical protein ACKVOR_13220 [Flavobacteriales bacterium]
MRLSFLSCLLLTLAGRADAQKHWHFGTSYTYGAAWNTHSSNANMLRPSDASSIGFIVQLDNGDNALGFQAVLSHRWYDVRHRIEEGYYMDNALRAVELRLQCTLPVGKKSKLALGMAPRMVTRHHWSVVYINKSNGGQVEYDYALQQSGDINALNSTIVFSWLFEMHKHWHLHIHAEQDIQKTYAGDALFENYDTQQEGEPALKLNALLTGLNGSLVFMLN